MLEYKSQDFFLSCISNCSVTYYRAPSGRGGSEYPSAGAIHVSVFSLVWSHKVHVVGTALSSTSVIGMLAVDPGISQTLFSSGHQHRCVEIRSQDYSSCASGPTVELWRQLTLTWPSPPTCTHPLSPKFLWSDCPSCQSTHRLFGCSVGAKFTAPTAEL